MTTLGMIIGLSLLTLLLGQAWLVIGFVRFLSRRVPSLPTDGACPRCTVILCLRGSDPFLPQCLEAILDQDYPHYDVRIIVDRPEDPAAAVVEQVLQRMPSRRVFCESLRERLSTCSLKCSSVVQAVRQLDPAVEFIAQLDADTVPHRMWLRELAGGLAPDDVGAATGNRWYFPPQPTWGSLVRYHWNAAAVVQMFWYRIAWGGTLAVKTKVIREVGLLDYWSQALCEDTMLFAKLRPSGYRIAFVASLIMINREACDLGDFHRWVQRQLLTAKLYHPGWFAVVGHALATSFAPLAALGYILVSFGSTWSAGVWGSLAGLVAYQFGLPLLVGIMEHQVRQVARQRREAPPQLSLSALFRWVLAIPLTQLVYASAMVRALLLRRVDWRGIDYRIGGPWDIEMLRYQPYGAQSDPEKLKSL